MSVDVQCSAHFFNNEICFQAILSPFSQEHHLKDIAEESHTDIERELAELDDTLSGINGLVGDEDPEADDNDPLAPDIIASDACAVDDIVSEVELSIQLPPLSTKESKLGQISIAKVSTIPQLISSPF